MILSGKEASNYFYTKLLKEIEDLPFKPKLAAVQVGNNPASNTYLKLKSKKLEELSLGFELIKFEENIFEKDLKDRITELNENRDYQGILVQLPLPKDIKTEAILNEVSPTKDVDCLNEASLGKFFSGNSEVFPATAKGVIKMLEYYKIPLIGKKVCVIGRSNLVTKPLAIELVNRNATVTICHSKTQNLSQETLGADIVISGIGKANFLGLEYFKNGQTVIDIGTSLDEGGKLSGDVKYEVVKDIVENLSPVPGGVGPMTIYGLIENLVLLTKKYK